MESIISYIVTLILECFIAYYFFSHRLTTTRSKPYVIAVHIMCYCILFAFTFFHNVYVNLLAFLIINFIIAQLAFNTYWRTSLFCSVILSITMSITELASELIPHAFFHKFDAPELDNSTMLLCFIISKSLYLIIILIISRNAQPSTHIQCNFHLTAIILLSLALVTLLSYVTLDSKLNHTSELILVIACSIVLIIMLIVLWLREYIEQKQAELFQTSYDLKQERNSKRYFELAKDKDETQKILIHDFKNHLMVLSKLCLDNKSEQAYDYIKQLFDSSVLSKKAEFTTNHNLNLILAIYDSKCRNLNISFTVDAQDTNINFMQAPDITALFCNLLDNAIEAATLSDNSFISVIIRKKNDTAYTISIVNSCANAPQLDNNGTLKTTKKDAKRHGFGFHSIRKIAEKYNGYIHNYYNEDDMTFHSIILIYDCRNEVQYENSNL